MRMDSAMLLIRGEAFEVRMSAFAIFTIFMDVSIFFGIWPPWMGLI